MNKWLTCVALLLTVPACGDGGDDSEGGNVNASSERAEQVFPKYCKNDVKCRTYYDTAENCESEKETNWALGHDSDACRDAILDHFECLSTAACAGYETACAAEDAAADAACD